MIQQQVLEPIVTDDQQDELASIAAEMERLAQRLRQLTERKDMLTRQYRTRPLNLSDRI